MRDKTVREVNAISVSAPPSYEELLKVLRPTTALLYRVVWHYSKRPGEVCRLPLRELARRLHVGQSTILLHMRALVQAGYVVDLTPEAHNKVHEYVISGKPVCEVQANEPEQWNKRVHHALRRAGAEPGGGAVRGAEVLQALGRGVPGFGEQDRGTHGVVQGHGTQSSQAAGG